MRFLRLPLSWSFVVFAVLISCSVTHAEDWLITTDGLQSQTALVRGISSTGIAITFIESGINQTIGFDHFVSLKRSEAALSTVPAFTLLLDSGDRLVGNPGPLTGDQLEWLSPSLGKLKLAMSTLRAICKGSEITLPDETPSQDTVTLINGDAVAGIFSGCGDGAVMVQGDAGSVSMPLQNIRRIVFASTGEPIASENTPAFRIHLTDSTVITVFDPMLDGDQLKFSLKRNTNQVISLPLSSVLSMEQINGPMSWLSSHRPLEQVQIPLFPGALSWPAHFDATVDGSPILFGRHVYEHGIGVHAYSRLRFAIDPAWRAFRTQYAIDSRRDMPRKYADVTVRIKLDHKVVLESKHVREGVLSPLVLLDLSGAKNLTLECDYGGAADSQAHLNWIEPALLRQMPSSTTQPTTPR